MRRIILIFCFFLTFTSQGQNRFEKAVEKFDSKEYATAETLFKAHLKDFPNHQKSREYLGDIAAHQRDWEKAIGIYEQLATSFPNIADYHFKYGGAMGMKASENNWFALWNYKEIRNQFEDAIRLNPSHIDAHWALITYYLELPAVLGGGKNQAEHYANRLLKLSKVDGFLALGKISEHFKDEKAAEINYVEANREGHSPHTFQTLGNFYEKNNQKKQALAVYLEAVEAYGYIIFLKDIQRIQKEDVDKK